MPARRPPEPALSDYNAFWIDLGAKLGVVKSEIRTSWIVDPPNGRVPYTDEGRRRMQEAATAQWRNFDGPEVRSLGERCIVGYGSTGGPPMLNVLYNNNYQIVQSPGFVVIVVEMNHDARIVRLGGNHLPQAIRPWMGDSIGHWDGDTLVVETTNFNPGQGFTADIRHRLYIPPSAKVTERFTRVGQGRDPLRVQGRGTAHLHATVARRDHDAGDRRARCTSMPATRAITRCRTSWAERACEEKNAKPATRSP